MLSSELPGLLHCPLAKGPVRFGLAAEAALASLELAARISGPHNLERNRDFCFKSSRLLPPAKLLLLLQLLHRGVLTMVCATKKKRRAMPSLWQPAVTHSEHRPRLPNAACAAGVLDEAKQCSASGRHITANASRVSWTLVPRLAFLIDNTTTTMGPRTRSRNLQLTDSYMHSLTCPLFAASTAFDPTRDTTR